ncbi:hypothetical protein VN24_16220 [Paenibacillus beijingensis]|uniref:Uncharacterized protein n=1 Tax=Paenibacillus beijingensis TaxID=1126833 RepID=A0A0D5NL06_9BACL|nr:hypothetical protein VN24_16220 [Paenibacillus beijingensis]
MNDQVIEIMAVAKIVAGDGCRCLEMYVDAAIVYRVICTVFEKQFAALENRAGRHKKIFFNVIQHHLRWLTSNQTPL